jgi:hypothetical protein
LVRKEEGKAGGRRKKEKLAEEGRRAVRGRRKFWPRS